MAYRPFPPPPQSTFAPAPLPNQNALQPPGPPQPPPGQGRGNQYSQNWGYSGSDFAQIDSGTNYQHYNQTSARNQMPPPPPHHQQQYAPPLPPPDSSYPPPPPPQMPSQPAPAPPMYYPTSQQYSQYSQQQPLQPLQPPPPPPPSSPPNSAVPPPPPSSPPPPPSSAPPAGQSKESRSIGEKGQLRDRRDSGWRDPGQSNQGGLSKQHKPLVPPVSAKKSNGPPGRVETEEERRLRKKREMEKQRQEEKRKQQLKESQSRVLHKTQMLSAGTKGHGSIIGSHIGERRTTPLLGGERIENRLKKPTTFLCKLKFRNELPDPTGQPKLMTLKRDEDRFTRYSITSLEKMHKPQLYVEPDLGIPLDLLDLSVYNPPKGERLPLDPEDEELLRDDDPVTPIKKDGIKRKERPTDKGVSWLVKTQYISPLSTDAAKQSLNEKQAKELRETRGGRNLLETLNSRERQIQEIQASFEACKSRPVHASNRKLQPVEVLPLLPDFDRYEDQFVVASFDSAPTADSEIFGKLEKDVRDAHESQAIMKSFVTTGSDAAKPDKFLGYMVPSPNELSKDIYDESEDISYSWVREYHWDVRGDDADDPNTYLVSFGDMEAHYTPLPTKLVLRKKRAREGKSSDEVEYFPVPKRITVRRRSTVAAIELKEEEDYPASKSSNMNSNNGGMGMEDGLGQPQKGEHDMDLDQYSEAEYESD